MSKLIMIVWRVLAVVLVASGVNAKPSLRDNETRNAQEDITLSAECGEVKEYCDKRCRTEDKFGLCQWACFYNRDPTELCKQILEAFERFDLDHDGFISVKEYVANMKSTGYPDANDVATAGLFARFDGDIDGKITYEEFISLTFSS